MKQRVLTVLLCMMILISATTISALGAPGEPETPLAVTFENPVWKGQTVALDVKLSNSSASAVNVSLIDLNLTVTGSYVSFTASGGSGVLAEAGDDGTVLLYREALGTTLTVPAKASETDGAVVLGTIKITADATGKAGLAQPTAEANNGVMSPGYQSSLLGSVTEFSGTVPTTGVTVSGLVKGYNSSHAPVAILYAATDATHSAALYTATIGTAAAADEQYTWTVSFANVAPGTYDLVVTKAAHLTYTVTGVVVGSTDVNLAADTAKAYSTMSMLAGDVDGDGWINFTDLQILRSTTNYGKQISDSGINIIADLNGDEWVNFTDMQLLRSTTNYGKSIGFTTVAYVGAA